MRLIQAGLMLAAASMLVGANGCADDCTAHTCSELAKPGIRTNARNYTKCYYGGGSAPLQVTLEDEAGEIFFDCTDSASKSCVEPTVDAKFDYCAVTVER